MGQRKSTAIATRLSRAKQLSSRTFLPPINRYSSILAETASATLPNLSHPIPGCVIRVGLRCHFQSINHRFIYAPCRRQACEAPMMLRARQRRVRETALVGPFSLWPHHSPAPPTSQDPPARSLSRTLRRP